jgi:hydrogenase nickel incorporation protein HypB
MCDTCGCSADASRSEHHHHHPYVHAPQPLERSHPHGTIVLVEEKVLQRNQRQAEENRQWFAERGILALNLVSSPGAGKTTLLERTIRDLGAEFVIRVIEGDQATDHDARRIAAAGSRVVQVNTGTGCHLDAMMIARALEELEPPRHALVLIENVGNLVCPALFDLGERAKVLICSITEGEDKPAKYPHMFRASTLLVLNKIDLLPHVDFDLGQFMEYVRQVKPEIAVQTVSARRGDGLTGWYEWLRRQWG